MLADGVIEVKALLRMLALLGGRGFQSMRHNEKQESCEV